MLKGDSTKLGKSSLDLVCSHTLTPARKITSYGYGIHTAIMLHSHVIGIIVKFPS